MHQTAPPLDPDTLYKALNADLKRRIEDLGRSTPQTFGDLGVWEIRFVSFFGVAGPLAIAWWLL